MKSYTDLKQSKKLADIIPPKSADMGWNVFVDDSTRCLPIDDWDLSKNGEGGVELIPCWSLAALLDVLPKNLNIGRPSLNSNYMGYYWIQYYDEFMKPNDYKTECFNNPVDACYKMILKLHELNLL